MSASDTLRNAQFRGVALAGSLLLTALALGCVTSTEAVHKAGGDSAASEPLLVQSGKVLVPAKSFQEVHYDTPFAAPPTLDVPDHWGRVGVAVPSATCFRVWNASHSDVMVEWKARGIKAPPAPVASAPTGHTITPVAATAAPPSSPARFPADHLPAEPVPVTPGR